MTKTHINENDKEKNNTARIGYRPWVVWGLAAAFFFCDYFARVSPSVMVKELMQVFEVSAAGLGGLNFFFYAPYLAMQIPVGLLVDRFGVYRILTVMCFLTGLSCSIFGAAQTVYGAQFGRFLLGFGASFAFVSALKLASDWFPPYRWGLLAGLTQALGMLGASVGEFPVSYAVQNIGWRYTLHLMMIAFLVLSVLIFLFVRDTPPHMTREEHKSNRTTNREMWLSLCRVLSHRHTWLNALYAGLIYAPTTVFAELWGVSYLERVQNLSIHQAAFATGLIFIGWAVGGPIMGWLSDRIGERKPLMYMSAICGFIFMGTVLFVVGLPSWAVYSLLFLFGMTNTGVATSYAVAAELNPTRYSGAAMAFTNMSSVIIGACLQPIVGVLLDWHASGKIVNNLHVYTAADYHASLLLLPLCSLLALFVAFSIRETHCTNISEKLLVGFE